MKLLTLLEKSKQFWFLLVTFFLFFLLRLPSFFEPYWYGDEGIYQVIGIAMRSGRLLYRDIWDNKPPLLYILYAIFSSDQFILRLVSFIFGALSVVVFFFLAKELFIIQKDHKTPKIVYFSTIVFTVLFGIPLIEGNIANSENFMALPILAAGFLIFKKMKKYDLHFSFLNSQLLITGFLLSLAFLFKIVAIFDFTAFTLFTLFLIFKNKQTTVRKKIFYTFLNLIPFFAGFLLPVFLIILFFLANGNLNDFLRASFFQNVGYVGYGNAFLISQGLLLVKLIILFIFLLWLFLKKDLSQKTLFILLWLGFSVFNALFSGRPYTHYLLVLVPSFCLFLGLVFSYRKYLKISVVILLISVVLISKNFILYEKTFSYYENFLLFALNKKDTDSYRAFFDHHTPIDYELAQFIKTHTTNKDNIFIWGNNAQLYKLVNKLPPGRYIVAYHITSSKEALKETQAAFYNTKPKYVIVSSRDFIPYSLINYSQKIIIGDSIIYEKFY